MPARLAIGLLALACLGAGPSTVWTPSPAFLPETDTASAIEKQIFDLTNRERKQRGLPPLEWDESLATAARQHSEDMLRRGYFSHDTPEGVSSEDRIHQENRRLIGTTGENIWSAGGFDAGQYSKLAEMAVSGWMNSPAHRADILNRDFTHLGVGIALGEGQVRATQNFSYIRAMLQKTPPAAIRSGEALMLTAPAPKFDLASAEGNTVFGPAPVNVPVPITAPPGTYNLRFYFPAGTIGNATSYTVFRGPKLQVR